MALTISFKGSVASKDGDSLLIQDVNVSIGSILLIAYVGKTPLKELLWGSDACGKVVSIKHSTLGVIELWYLKPQTIIGKDLVLKSNATGDAKLMLVGVLEQLVNVSNYITTESKGQKAVIGPMEYNVTVPTLAMAIVFTSGKSDTDSASWDGTFTELPILTFQEGQKGDNLACRMGYALIGPGKGNLKLGLNFSNEQHFLALMIVFEALAGDKFIGTEIEIIDYVPPLLKGSDEILDPAPPPLKASDEIGTGK